MWFGSVPARRSEIQPTSRFLVAAPGKPARPSDQCSMSKCQVFKRSLTKRCNRDPEGEARIFSHRGTFCFAHQYWRPFADENHLQGGLSILLILILAKGSSI
jgi:hypothetical protein